jgi:hypothetical protein
MIQDEVLDHPTTQVKPWASPARDRRRLAMRSILVRGTWILTGSALLAAVAVAMGVPESRRRDDVPSVTGQAAWFLAEPLAHLDLNPTQRTSIDRIRRSNEDWLETLGHEFASARAASLATIGRDFDSPHTGRRFRRQGEIAAYIWGNQARITNEVAELLEPDQREVLLASIGASSGSSLPALAHTDGFLARKGE